MLKIGSFQKRSFFGGVGQSGVSWFRKPHNDFAYQTQLIFKVPNWHFFKFSIRKHRLLNILGSQACQKWFQNNSYWNIIVTFEPKNHFKNDFWILFLQGLRDGLPPSKRVKCLDDLIKRWHILPIPKNFPWHRLIVQYCFLLSPLKNYKGIKLKPWKLDCR